MMMPISRRYCVAVHSAKMDTFCITSPLQRSMSRAHQDFFIIFIVRSRHLSNFLSTLMEVMRSFKFASFSGSYFAFNFLFIALPVHFENCSLLKVWVRGTWRGCVEDHCVHWWAGEVTPGMSWCHKGKLDELWSCGTNLVCQGRHVRRQLEVDSLGNWINLSQCNVSSTERTRLSVIQVPLLLRDNFALFAAIEYGVNRRELSCSNPIWNWRYWVQVFLVMYRRVHCTPPVSPRMCCST